MQIVRKTVVPAVAAVALACAVAAAQADILVLRDGTRVEGTLVGVRGDTFEFERSGWGRRVDRYDRADVRRVEIDSDGGDRRDDRSYRRDRDERDDSGRYGRPSGLRERTVSVSAGQAWSETGVVLRAGQSVYFSAAGQVRWGKDRRDDAGGEHNSPRNPGRPIPDRPGAALIGRVDNDDPFFIGNDDGAIRVRGGGRLRLGINDDYLLDNSGEFRVTIYY